MWLVPPPPDVRHGIFASKVCTMCTQLDGRRMTGEARDRTTSRRPPPTLSDGQVSDVRTLEATDAARVVGSCDGRRPCRLDRIDASLGSHPLQELHGDAQEVPARRGET